MFFLQILIILTSCTVIVLEVYSGALGGPLWWVLPGALVIAMVLAFADVIMRSTQNASPPGPVAGAFQWIVIFAFAVGMSYTANYLGRVEFQNLYEEKYKERLQAEELQQPD